MLRDVAYYGTVAAIGFAYLGLLGLHMIKSAVKDAKLEPFDQ
tara:strand:- start:883 stop:1008 length:126 start_codon:yes stop_codon:yes gene_type:complete